MFSKSKYKDYATKEELDEVRILFRNLEKQMTEIMENELAEYNRLYQSSGLMGIILKE